MYIQPVSTGDRIKIKFKFEVFSYLKKCNGNYKMTAKAREENRD